MKCKIKFEINIDCISIPFSTQHSLKANMYVRIVFRVSTAYLNGYIVFDKFNLSQQTTTKGFSTHLVNIVVRYLNNIFNRKNNIKTRHLYSANILRKYLVLNTALIWSSLVYISYIFLYHPEYQGHKKLALILLNLNEEAKRKFICRNKAFNYVVSLAPIILLYFPAHKLLHGIWAIQKHI